VGLVAATPSRTLDLTAMLQRTATRASAARVP
jgi:hypothetical protein